MRENAACENKISVALAGNPNVGKSTLFNSLTGMRRHTGNWAGKTVDVAVADVAFRKRIYSVADIPGTYSLLSHSFEEEVARNYICFGGADVTVVVCDATSLEHSLSLVLQICEVCDAVIVAVNLIDEARARGITVDFEKLSRILKSPVVPIIATKRRSIKELLEALDRYDYTSRERYSILYPDKISEAIEPLEKALTRYNTATLSKKWLAMRLVEDEGELRRELFQKLGIDECEHELIAEIDEARKRLFEKGVDADGYRDAVVGKIISEAEKIAGEVTTMKKASAREREEKIDRLVTGKYTAFPIMACLLAVVLFITLYLAGYPSGWLSSLFCYVEEKLLSLFYSIKIPKIITEAFIYGIYRTTATVIAVMLPPMAIFFPMFALLEDSGYLPRVAYNLDRPFAACGACGKQSLTMCMGLGCNAVGIVGARIIDSRRERILAVVTNSLVPCNGRFPMLISLICATFLIALGNAPTYLVFASLFALILFSVAVTFILTAILGKTLLAGERSSFTIELTPYRKPAFFKVIFRSLSDKVASVLARAVAVAAPMGLLIFILSRLGVSEYISELLDPLGRALCLDGKILLAFLLGLPANEIILPILVMLYTSGASFGGDIGTAAMTDIFLNSGWTVFTAISITALALFHFPCSTSIITAYKETKSKKYTLLTAFLPLAVGFTLCFLIKLVSVLFF